VQPCDSAGLEIVVPQRLESVQLLAWVLLERQLAQPEQAQLSVQVELIVTVPLALSAREIAEKRAIAASASTIIPILLKALTPISVYLRISSATSDIVLVHIPPAPDEGMEIFQKMLFDDSSIASDCVISMASVDDATDSEVILP
jgi:hypothetical protein